MKTGSCGNHCHDLVYGSVRAKRTLVLDVLPLFCVLSYHLLHLLDRQTTPVDCEAMRWWRSTWSSNADVPSGPISVQYTKDLSWDTVVYSHWSLYLRPHLWRLGHCYVKRVRPLPPYQSQRKSESVYAWPSIPQVSMTTSQVFTSNTPWVYIKSSHTPTGTV